MMITDKPEFLTQVITANELWIHHYDLLKTSHPSGIITTSHDQNGVVR